MLTLTLAWLILLAASWLGGLAILACVHAEALSRLGDRFIVSAWLGLGLASTALLGLSLFFALSPRVGMAVGAGFLVISLSHVEVRNELRSFIAALSPKLVACFFVLSIGCAGYSSRVVQWFDTGFYHFGAISWFSRYGAVPGLGLLHIRFATTSGWFALSAPFNASWLEGRIATLANGAALLLALTHFSLCLTRLITGRSRFADWFIIAALGLLIPIVAYFNEMPLSSSPDFPVIVLTVVTVWTMIVLAQAESDSIGRNIAAAGAGVIPFILALETATIKISGLALLPATFLFLLYYRSGKRPSVKRPILGAAIGALFMTPLLGYEAMTSGCLLFPVSRTCLNLPWSMEATAPAYSLYVRDYARWRGHFPPDIINWNWMGEWVQPGGNSWNWMWGWLTRGAAFKNVTLGFGAAFVLLAGASILLFARKLKLRIGRWLLAFIPPAIAFASWLLSGIAIKSVVFSAIFAAGLLVCVSIAALTRRLAPVWLGGGVKWLSDLSGPVFCGVMLVAAGIAGLLYLLMSRAQEVLIVTIVSWVLIAPGPPFKGRNWALAAGLSGVALMMYAAPELRFGLGYVSVLFASALLSNRKVTQYLTAHARGQWRSAREFNSVCASILAVTGVLCFLSLAPLQRQPQRPYVRMSADFTTNELPLLTPPGLKDTEVTEERINDIEYFKPKDGHQCWAAELPCAPDKLPENVMLRDAARGIGGGFVLSRRTK